MPKSFDPIDQGEINLSSYVEESLNEKPQINSNPVYEFKGGEFGPPTEAFVSSLIYESTKKMHRGEVKSLAKISVNGEALEVECDRVILIPEAFANIVKK